LKTFWEWEKRSPDGTWTRHTLRPEILADLEKVERVGIKYICGWADYDHYGADIHNESNGDELRRDLAKFKSLKEVLLSHDAADGGFDLEPGRTELLDYDENRIPGTKSENEYGYLYVEPYELLPMERAERVLRDFRTKNLTPEEVERGIPEVKLVVVNRILNVPPYVNTTLSPYVSTVSKLMSPSLTFISRPQIRYANSNEGGLGIGIFYVKLRDWAALLSIMT
jgi:hypothetical protein